MSEENIKVLLNGEQLTFDVPPQLIDDRTMVPMRAIFEALKAEVEWFDDTQTIRAETDEKIIELQINNKKLSIFKSTTQDKSNPELEPYHTILLDVPPTLVNGRALAPVRAVAWIIYQFVWRTINLRIKY
ncbi:MAG: copper amine oxidase N-terminal domain-containing protein [Eubacteriales bacterium]|nr:copper amine oxidase N-terminal domain-containing protein [Eubacteriales bacterium]